MNASRGRTLIQGGLLALALLGLSYWGWQRHHRPAAPIYEGKTLDQWLADLDDPDYQVSDRAANVFAQAGGASVPILLDARERGDIRLHRRAAAVLVRIGAPAAPGLVAALEDKPKEQRIEVALVRLGPVAVPALREALHDEKGEEGAAHVLGLIGARAADAVPDLLTVLQRPQAPASVRSEAAFALGRIGEPSAAFVPALSAALKDSNRDVRAQAAEALGWIGTPARAATPALVVALKDDDTRVTKNACQALAFVGDGGAAPSLLEAFQSDRAAVAVEAGRALWRLGPKAQAIAPALFSLAAGPLEKTASARDLLASFGPRVVPNLMKALRDDEAARREAAAEVLGRIGPPAREAVPALLAALKDKNSAVALTAALALAEVDSTRAGPVMPLLADSLNAPGAAAALANIGPDARAAVPALIAALKPRKDATHADVLRAGARLALARIGTPAVPALIEALKDKREGVAPLAGEALGWILPPPKEAIPALRQAIANDRAQAGVYVRALGQLRSAARAAVPDLIALLPDAASRSEAARALMRIDPDQAEKAVPLLVKDLQAPEEAQRQRAVVALGRLGPRAKAAAPDLVNAVRGGQLTEPALLFLPRLGRGAIPSLVDLLADKDVKYRQAAVMLLYDLGPAACEALPALIIALSDADSAVRIGAARVMEMIGPEAGKAVPALIANLQTYQTQVRLSAAVALGHIGPTAVAARRPLLECLLDPDEQVRYAAALALGRIDPDFTEAAPALRDARNDPSPMVRLAAIDSLRSIEPRSNKDSVPLLVALCAKPEDVDVRFRAVEGLIELAPEEAKRAVSWLSVELTDSNPANVLYAARLLARLEPSQSERLVLALAAALRTPLAEARRLIVQTLAEFGSQARAVVPEIERLLQDGAPGMRDEAIKALRVISPARAKQRGVD